MNSVEHKGRQEPSIHTKSEENPLYADEIKMLHAKAEKIIDSAQNIESSKLCNVGIDIFNQGYPTRVLEVKDRAIMDGKTVDLGRSREDSACLQLSISSHGNKKATTIWYEMMPDGSLRKKTDLFVFDDSISYTQTESSPLAGDIELLGYVIENFNQKVLSSKSA